MRVLAIVPSVYDTSPGQRYRIEQWEPYLRDHGIEIDHAPFETTELRNVLYQPGNTYSKVRSVISGFKRRNSEVVSAMDYDLVYLFREAALLGPAWFERRIARRVPIVFDFDDAIFVAYKSPSNGYLSYLKFPRKTETIIRLSSHVMAGNPYLAEYSRRFNDNVTVIPTTIDTDVYTVVEKTGGDVPVVTWTGSYSTVQHLDTIREALRELAERHRFQLLVIGTDRYEISGVEVKAVPWRSATEIDDLRPTDIGIMPLPDDKWSKGKCGLKALQYMALGKPAICSPVGVNTEIITEGVNGYLASGRDEWVAKLSKLLEDRELRSKLGREARRTVEERYSASSQVPRVAEIFESVVKRRK